MVGRQLAASVPRIDQSIFKTMQSQSELFANFIHCHVGLNPKAHCLASSHNAGSCMSEVLQFD
jgi:hypothetical protein